MNRLLFDTESNGLLDTATKIHCVAAIDVDTKERLDWKPDDNGYLEALDKADVLIGHNIQRHDIPLITKLTSWKPRPTVKLRDTMIIARLEHPNVKDTDKQLIQTGKMPAGKKYQGKHTLGAWGYRLGCHKGDYADIKEAEWLDLYPNLAKELPEDKLKERILEYVWGTWSPEMHAYMLQDRETNLALWDFLQVDEYSQDAIDLEHRIARVCDLMERAGVPFDVPAAGKLQGELLTERDNIERALVAKFGFWYAPVSPNPDKATFYPKQTSKTSTFVGWEDGVPQWKGSGYTEGCPATKLKLVQFNPGSRDHIAKVLLAKGWEPTKMTEGGKPQIDEETVEAIVARYPEFDGLGRYLMLEKRLSQLADGKRAWLAEVKDDGRIHGVINPMGTTTSRASHMYPNLGQVPNAASPYGPECRALFYAPKGWSIVGADQQGLELRGLAHYLVPMDGGKYAKVVLEGDPHWLHAQVMGLAEGERDKHNKLHVIIREDGSKRFIYAYVYGCWDEKAGEIIYTCLLKAMRECGDIGGKELYVKFFGDGQFPTKRKLIKVGNTVRSAFLNRLEGFGKLKEKLTKQVDQFHWVPGLDGRRIPTRSDHSALNFLIQSAGAIVCKRWVVDAFDAMCAAFRYDFDNPWNGEFVFGLWVHDEIQVWVREGLEEKTCAILKATASKAGEPYGFRVRLDGEAKVGKNWKDTH
jgi:hypothetical protein